MTSQEHHFSPEHISQPRLSAFPIQHHDLWESYKLQLRSFWTAEEIDFSQDRNQWNTRLTDNERSFVKNILAFFAGADSVVAMNLMDNFFKEVPIMEAKAAYTVQAAMESVHSEVYSIMIDTFIQDADEKLTLFNELGKIQCVRDKIQWASDWALNSEESSFPRRLLAFIIVEGLFFSGAFCAIYWLKHRGLLPGLTKSNEFIARDEGMHTQFGSLIYKKLREESKLSQEEAHEMFREALAIEKRFITESVPCGMVGMKAEEMTQYIEYVADGLLGNLGYDKLFGVGNPFHFMELIGLNARSNFFEERVSLYQKAGAAAGYTEDF